MEAPTFGGRDRSDLKGKVGRARRAGASGLVLAFLRGRLGGFGKFGVGLELLDRLFLVAVVHRLLEATHGGAEIGSDGLQLLGPEDQQHDEEYDNEFFETNRAHEALLEWGSLRT